MSEDDMEIIMYKILKYLYECLKSGRKTSIADVAWECCLFHITRTYWLVIMRELIESGYVSGIQYIAAKDMEQILEVGTFSITKAGREYLSQNGMMQKAKEFLGKPFEILLGAVIGRL